LFAVNFGDSEPVRLLINCWVEDQTEERIKDLLPEGALTVDTRLVLTNAIYFKASWMSEFDPALTD
jgi:serpin B